MEITKSGVIQTWSSNWAVSLLVPFLDKQPLVLLPRIRTLLTYLLGERGCTPLFF